MNYKKLMTHCMVLGAFAFGFCYWQNNHIQVTKHTYTTNIPEDLDGFTITQVSDLQSKSFGADQNSLLEKVAQTNPNIIVITGDLIDRNHTDIEASMTFIAGARKIAPIYFVTGNHEHQSGVWEELSDLLIEADVTILDNGKSIIEYNNEIITLIGLADKRVNPYYAEALSTLTQGMNPNGLTILLSHRPELFESYAEYPIDLAFTGHAHGGQIRLPFVGGLFAPNQGFFPEYTSGAYEINDTTMYVSRGLGNSTFPIRFGNRPEIVVVTLEAEEM
ncbi:metallophosphoesterase [Chakrabartyella piscis]|uniref:metallophosphoesterase n=1 Tax=Chakrabartyella piscis TaxID=2918914 RepID=UPI0029587D07|nr:metallophosphoesterase [Chakrabartyella piscis]